MTRAAELSASDQASLRILQLEGKLDRSTRERDELRASLQTLVTYLEKHGGYMSAANQAALRGAKSLLAELASVHVERREIQP